MQFDYYASKEWEGSLKRSAINGSQVDTNYDWEASDLLPSPGSRKIWTSLQGLNDDLNNFIDTKLNELNLSDKDLSLVGFSQGTMMSLHVGLRRIATMSSIVGFSGRLIREDILSDEMKSKPPVYLIHGDQDPMVPYSDTINAAKILKDLDIDVQSHISPNTPHSIAQDGLEIAKKFLSSNFSQNK